jgi:hypothetical protein
MTKVSLKKNVELELWSQKCCDLKGVKGINLKNYAVLGMSTLYLINKEGEIVQKTSRFNEVLEYLIEK